MNCAEVAGPGIIAKIRTGMPGKPTQEPLDRLTQEEVQHYKENQQVEVFFPCMVKKCHAVQL